MDKVIFWDFDGTLVKSNASFFESLDCALRENGYSIDEELLKGFLKENCSWNVPEKSYPEAVGEKWWQDLLAKLKSFCKENDVEHDRIDLVCEQFRKNVICYPYELYADAEDALRYSQSIGYVNHLLSNNFPELVATVERFGLSKYFSEYHLSANIGYEKPRKEIFEYALNAANTPQVCYMVGDNPIADIAGAQAAGIQTIMVHRKPIEEVKPDYWCVELRDIANVLK